MSTDPKVYIQHLKNEGGIALSLHLHPVLFSYALTNRTTGIIVKCVSKKWEAKGNKISSSVLNTWLKEHQEILNQPFEIIKIGINSTAFNLVNDSDLATEKSFQILNEFSGKTHQLYIDSIENDLIVQFAVNKKITEILRAYFNESAICFGDRGILKAVKNDTTKNVDFVLCQILENELTLVVFNKGKLVLFNKYEVKTPEDVLYFILAAYQNNGLNPNQNLLYITGLIEKDSSIYTLIFNYVRNVEFTSGFKKFSMKDELIDVSEHYFFNLFNLQ